MRGSICCVACFAIVTLFGGVVGALDAVEVDDTSALYLVFEADDAGLVTPVFARRVELAAPLDSKSDEEIEASEALALRRDVEHLRLQLKAADGRVAYQDVVKFANWVRGEFRGQQTANRAWTMESHRVRPARRAFVVRVPVLRGAQLVFEGRTRSTFDLDALDAASQDLPLARLAAPEGAVMTMRAQNGNPANRVDLLLMGDGYTAAEEALFNSHIDEFDFWFFLVTPYAEYSNFVNTVGYFVPSLESGADHPPYDPACVADDPSCCADPEAITDPLAGTYVETQFDARFCSFNIHRLLVVDVAAVFAAASAMPDWDLVIVAVNDPTYGGAGGPLAVVSIHEDALEIVQHEYGHSFTALADEYDTPAAYPDCSDITGPACEANVTDETVRNLIKWSAWIEPTTPVPTPEGLPEYAAVVGLFEGARYRATGMYRPADFDCMMNLLSDAFCPICSQEYVLRLYRGGWGVPVAGIDPIEPGSEIPPTGQVADGTAGLNLSVELLQPVGSPPLDETWLVDGVPETPTGAPGTFAFASSEPGTHFVEIRVEDVSPLIHPTMAGGPQESSRVWEIDVGLAAGPGRVDSLDLGKSTMTPGDLVLDWAASCSPGAVDYAIHEGTLGNFYSHVAKDCSDDGDPLTEEILPAAGDTYYLVVPLTTDAEGSYGTASGPVERPQGAATCRTLQVLATCPP